MFNVFGYLILYRHFTCFYNRSCSTSLSLFYPFKYRNQRGLSVSHSNHIFKNKGYFSKKSTPSLNLNPNFIDLILV